MALAFAETPSIRMTSIFDSALGVDSLEADATGNPAVGSMHEHEDSARYASGHDPGAAFDERDPREGTHDRSPRK